MARLFVIYDAQRCQYLAASRTAIDQELSDSSKLLLLMLMLIRLDALALSVIATATWLAGWVAGCLSQPVLYQND